MLVITRHRPADVGFFLDVTKDAFAALATRPGFVRAELGRAPDDPSTYVVCLSWTDIGSYRRAISPVDIRTRVLPMYNSAIDEDGVFEVLYGVDRSGSAYGRESDLTPGN